MRDRKVFPGVLEAEQSEVRGPLVARASVLGQLWQSVGRPQRVRASAESPL